MMVVVGCFLLFFFGVVCFLFGWLVFVCLFIVAFFSFFRFVYSKMLADKKRRAADRYIDRQRAGADGK